MKKVEIPTFSAREQEAIITADKEDARLMADLHAKASELVPLLEKFVLVPLQRRGGLQDSLALEVERDNSKEARLLLKIIQGLD